ncbi:exodeoxyribonuclease III [Amphibiibacter pelophylacis]|uniref:Exodeoxyribonuclease III n=1 Tax=Amphibiibacter pelophylacis TaxID=1799477 RepID=A0ACC6P2F0_9BURK
MKAATWNVNSLSVRLPQVLDWLAAHQPQVLVLQETKLTDDKFPHEALAQAGYTSLWHGQKTYNGVALLARAGCQVSDPVKNIPGFEDEQARVIAATVDGVRVVGGYFPNGQAPDSDKFAYKMRWLDALRAWLQGELVRTPDLLLMGDFNICPTDADVYDPVAWAGQIHCTPQEREHFQALTALGLVDAFRLFEQPVKSWSWWDYRNLAFRKNQGLRIDHILASQPLVGRVTACEIDRLPRKNERPSDHAPVWVQLDPA